MSPRSWNRREFNVSTAGWFTVLKPAGWFSTASRLTAGSPNLAGSSRRSAASATSALEGNALGLAARRGTIVPPEILKPGTQDRSLLRVALIVFSAAAITFGLLWWLARANP
jgi:hypothetical protein